ncbi:hypothetical protein PRUPE_2G167400 [Prunus persica]|uniref:Uncharacterized protein n=1 Tax=Prunus persica TaxID=3760 RepID=A0A251QK55_PRUPE|nr:hypothetical protein PRUPE_2G167400 [Prunus persica]
MDVVSEDAGAKDTSKQAPLTPNHSGIGLDNLLCPTSMTTKLVQFFKDEGNCPTNLLLLNLSVSIRNRDPIVVGIFPDKAL